MVRRRGGECDAGAWNDEVDVIVAGAGGAGLAAAIELADTKADVVVFEKQCSIEDTSTYQCGGLYTFAGTDFQQREGIKDSNALLYKDLIEVGQRKNNEKLVQAYVKNQLDTYYWLTNLGVKWTEIEAAAGMSVPRSHRADPAETLIVLKEAAERKGVKLIFETAVTRLLVDKDGRVTGVTAKGKERSVGVKARKGVILATGGFGRSIKMLEAIDPRLSQIVPIVGVGHTGDGHRMAEELGAFFKDMEYVKPTFGIHVTGTSNAELTIMFYSGAIIVNKEGKRFCNESISYKDVAKAALDQPDGIGYQIFDQKIYEIGVEKAKGLRPDEAIMYLDEGRIKLLVKADTIEALASKIAVPPKTLSETVDKYNIQSDAGKDLDFGRTTLAGGVGQVIRIDTPPFYAYASKGTLPGTYGGVVVDEDMNVLNRQGKIPSLYAAGEIVGGFHGASYMSGTAVGKALIFGRIAARNVAKGL